MIFHFYKHIVIPVNIFKKPIIELHISNIYNREKFRQKSLISNVVTGGIFGLGTNVLKFHDRPLADQAQAASHKCYKFLTICFLEFLFFIYGTVWAPHLFPIRSESH